MNPFSRRFSRPQHGINDTTEVTERQHRPQFWLRKLTPLLALAVAGVIAAVPVDATGSEQTDDGLTIATRAIGTSGTEQFEIRVNGDVVLAETASTQWDVYETVLPAGTNIETAEVHFIEDFGAVRDLRVDYLEIDDVRYESEDRTTRAVGTWAGGTCVVERDSFSEWLHCKGWFGYDVADAQTAPAAPVVEVSDPTTTTTATTTTATESPDAPSSSDIVIRSKGKSGEETLELRIDGTAVANWTVTTEWAEYRHPVASDAAIDIVETRFTNDGGVARDLQVDYIEVNGNVFEAEASSTRTSGTYSRDTGCSERASDSQWLHCNGGFTFSISDNPGPVTPVAPTPPAPTTTEAPTTPVPTTAAPTTTAAPAPTAAPPTTQIAPVPPAPPQSNTRYSIAQVIDGTISAGDGSNPNEEAPMGRHDASLYLPQGWNWSQGPTRNSVWGQLGTGGSQFAEWRCAVIPEFGHQPSVPFRINVRNGAYYQFVGGSWNKAFDVDLLGGNHGGYLGQAGQLNQNPFSSGGHGLIQWRREADGSFSAPWNSNALMMHFWASQRQAPASGQTAEFLTSEVRLQQPDGSTVDLSQVRVLFQCGIDYYSTTGGQGTQVPGPGIAKYHRVTTEAKPGLWVTLPGNVPAASVADFERWLRQNPPPNVG